MSSQSSVDAFVAEPAFALVGVSRSGKKFGNLACRELKSKGYRVYPIHPGAAEIDGTTCYRSFADLPEHVNAVIVTVPPERAIDVVREAAAAGIHRVWLQQGAESPAVLQACQGLDLDVISGECVLMFARPASYHKVHRWIWNLTGHQLH
jgi:hypothetical protein